MSEATRPAARALLVTALLVLAPAAGCLETVGEATQDALTDEPAPAPAPDGDVGDEAEAGDADPGEAQEVQGEATSYEAALAKLEPGDDSVERVSMAFEIDPLEDSTGESVSMNLLVDKRQRVMALTVTNRSQGGEAGVVSGDTFLLGAVAKTTFIGNPSAAMGVYNESSDWEDGWGNLTDSDVEAGESSGSSPNLTDPTSLLEALDEVPDEAEFSARETTHEGQPARQVDVAFANETSEVDASLVLGPDAGRPLHLDATIRGQAGEGGTGPGHVTVDFAYGEDATHPHEEGLVRLEATTIERENSIPLGSPDGPQNWTVQPSQNPGSIPLEEVEVQLQGSASEAGAPDEAEVMLALPAEDGRASTENATLVYEDRDDDGAVSPGDRIQFTAHTDEADGWTLSLYDEQTGMRSVPLGGLAAILSTVGAAWLGLHRSRRRGGDR